MGKRQRRRQREQQKSADGAVASVLFLPNEENPLIRVEIDHDTPDDLRGVCARYWQIAMDPEPTWRYRVAELGDEQWVIHSVPAKSRAFLLVVPCQGCREPLPVRNRTAVSQVASLPRLASGQLGRKAKQYCASCREQGLHFGPSTADPWSTSVPSPRSGRSLPKTSPRPAPPESVSPGNAVAAAAVKVAAEHEAREAARIEAEVRSLWEREVASQVPSTAVHALSLRGLVIAEAMVDLLENGAKVLPAAADTQWGWTGRPEKDVEELTAMYSCGFLALDVVSMGAAAFQDGRIDALAGSYAPGLVTFRLTQSASEARVMLRDSEEFDSQSHSVCKEIVEQALSIQAYSVLAYLDDLITREYQYPPLPSTRHGEAHTAALGALRAGWHRDQACSVAWRAAASAAAWKERNAHISESAASSATITTFVRYVTSNLERDIQPQHYIPRPRTPMPLASTTALDLAERFSVPEFVHTDE
ncbi:hypothetical protein [Kitasatospora purpeofusca]|uniref:hypothetical protein n=1 Tax=Kitasatospora purpeofusca TaxID=67352 RepID=UPI003821736B